MDILTLGKMNAMARNTDTALELMANHLYDSQQDICAFQAGNVDQVNSATAAGLIELQDYANVTTSTDQKHFFIYNTSHWSVTNGGCCLQWTVPSGASIIEFEVLSGGGPGGSSGGDYDMGVGGAGGNYITKTLCREAGDFTSAPGTESVYSLCAGGTSPCSCCCSCNRNCRHGCTSYVTGPGLTNFCAIGGHGGSTSWDVNHYCFNCHQGNLQCDKGNYNAGWVTHNCNEHSGDPSSLVTNDGDMCFRGITGSYHRDCGVYGCASSHNFSGGAAGPFTTSGTGVGKHFCTGDMACCSGHSAFPGGGGVGHQIGSSSACWGGFGAGGLVKVTYQ